MPHHHPPALQAAPGQRSGASPGTNSPLDCLCPGSGLANERVQTKSAGQVVLKLKTPWRDGTMHPVTSPLEFMQGLATLVPRRRLHLIRYGVRITSLREVSSPPQPRPSTCLPTLVSCPWAWSCEDG